MSVVLDGLRASRDEILARIEKVSDDLARARADLAAVDVAIAAIQRIGTKRGYNRGGATTIKQTILDVLALYPNGTDARTILQEVRERYRADIGRESVAPQLSRLKEEGLIRREGKTWMPAKEQDNAR